MLNWLSCRWCVPMWMQGEDNVSVATTGADANADCEDQEDSGNAEDLGAYAANTVVASPAGDDDDDDDVLE